MKKARALSLLVVISAFGLSVPAKADAERAIDIISDWNGSYTGKLAITDSKGRTQLSQEPCYIKIHTEKKDWRALLEAGNKTADVVITTAKSSEPVAKFQLWTIFPAPRTTVSQPESGRTRILKGVKGPSDERQAISFYTNARGLTKVAVGKVASGSSVAHDVTTCKFLR